MEVYFSRFIMLGREPRFNGDVMKIGKTNLWEYEIHALACTSLARDISKSSFFTTARGKVFQHQSRSCLKNVTRE